MQSGNGNVSLSAAWLPGAREGRVRGVSWPPKILSWGQKLYMTLVSDRCQSNGNDHLSNFDALTHHVPAFTYSVAKIKTCCELSHARPRNPVLRLRDRVSARPSCHSAGCGWVAAQLLLGAGHIVQSCDTLISIYSSFPSSRLVQQAVANFISVTGRFGMCTMQVTVSLTATVKRSS